MRPGAALLIECGQHWSAESPKVALDVALRFLRHFGAAAPEFVDRHISSTPAPRQKVIEVTDSIPFRTGAFAFLWPPSDLLSIVPKAGTLIARDGDREIRTPYDDCALVMPMRRTAKPGDTAVRLGRFVG